MQPPIHPFRQSGWTVGVGFEWMLNADIAYASEDTRFKLPEASLGVFMTGGLVYRVLPNEELDAVTLDACHKLADLKPMVAMQFKRVLNMFGLERFGEAIDEESNVQRILGRNTN
ncbi:MAG: hypothetical protein WCH60_07635 [Burkholderiales bacterium]